MRLQVLDVVYGYLARALTSWENHPTTTRHTNSLILKLAVFRAINRCARARRGMPLAAWHLSDCSDDIAARAANLRYQLVARNPHRAPHVNSYFSLLYIAAIKGHISIGGQLQQCANNSDGVPDCMSELQSQLAILLITRFLLIVLFGVAWPAMARALEPCTARCCIVRRRKTSRPCSFSQLVAPAADARMRSDTSPLPTPHTYTEGRTEAGSAARGRS